MLTLTLVAITVTACIGIACHVCGWRLTAYAAILASLCILPGQAVGISTYHPGVAGGEPRIMTYNIVLVVIGVLAILAGRWIPFPPGSLMLAVYLLSGLFFWWKGSTEQWSGALQIGVALVAWGVGSWIAQGNAMSLLGDRRILLGALGVASVQVVVSALQVAGMELFPVDAEALEYLAGRANGTMPHPSTLGKMLLIMSAFVLPFTESTMRTVRYAAYLVIVLSLVSIALAGGRAIFAAAVILILFWALLIPRQAALGSRVMLLGILVVAILASAGIYAARFESDPAGGERDHLLEVALERLPTFFLAGTGPNSYVTEIGRYDAIVARGWPVHNVPLMAVIELGLLGALLLLYPVARLLVLAWTRRRQGGVTGQYSRAVIALAIALIPIAFTEWGLLHEYTLPWWFFVGGFCYAAIRSSADSILPSIHADKGAKSRGNGIHPW